MPWEVVTQVWAGLTPKRLIAPRSRSFPMTLQVITLYVGNQEDAHEFVTKVLGRETHHAQQSTFQSFDHPSLHCATCGVLTTSQLAGYDVLSLPVCTPLGVCITSVQSAMDAYLAPRKA